MAEVHSRSKRPVAMLLKLLFLGIDEVLANKNPIGSP